MTDDIKRLLKGKSIDDKIKSGLKKKGKKHDRIIDMLKKEKRKPDYIFSKNVIQQLKKSTAPTIDVSDVKSEYDITVNDRSVQNPYIVSSGLVKIIRKHVKPYKTAEDKSKAIFLWIHDNVEYGQDKKEKGYSNSKEVMRYKQGVCGEMSFLYITMARCCGLRSAFVEVDIDYRGKDVAHACAVVDTGKKDVFVDVAYHKYDIMHKDYTVLPDSEVIRRFNQWR